MTDLGPSNGRPLDPDQYKKFKRELNLEIDNFLQDFYRKELPNYSVAECTKEGVTKSLSGLSKAVAQEITTILRKKLVSKNSAAEDYNVKLDQIEFFEELTPVQELLEIIKKKTAAFDPLASKKLDRGNYLESLASRLDFYLDDIEFRLGEIASSVVWNAVRKGTFLELLRMEVDYECLFGVCFHAAYCASLDTSITSFFVREDWQEAMDGYESYQAIELEALTRLSETSSTEIDDELFERLSDSLDSMANDGLFMCKASGVISGNALAEHAKSATVDPFLLDKDIYIYPIHYGKVFLGSIVMVALEGVEQEKFKDQNIYLQLLAYDCAKGLENLKMLYSKQDGPDDLGFNEGLSN